MSEMIKVDTASNGDPRPIPMRCPACHREGAFERVQDHHDFVTNNGSAWLGHRQCPIPECRTHVFVVWGGSGRARASYPPERVDFDRSHVPSAVAAIFEEALICGSNRCFTAAAMLVRKTLELLCDDRGAQGKDLKERIADLRRVVILPESLLNAADALRLLGNDAAHVMAKTYNNIGEDEVAVAAELTKEILKAVYQYDAILAKLNALKK